MAEEFPLVRRIWKNTQSGDPRFADIDSKILRALRMRTRVEGRDWYILKWTGPAEKDAIEIEYPDGKPITIALQDKYNSVDPDHRDPSGWYGVMEGGREVGTYKRFERDAGPSNDQQFVLLLLFKRS